MARRSKRSGLGNNKKLPLYIVASIIGLVAVFALTKKNKSEPVAITSSFPVAQYMERASNLRDNSYVLRGKVIDRTASPSADEEMLSVRVNNGPQSEILPVIVPSQAKTVNVEREQDFIFQVVVKDVSPQCRGIIIANRVTSATD